MARIVMLDDKDESETEDDYTQAEKEASEDIETEDDYTQAEKEASKKPRKKYEKRTVEVRADSIANQTRSKRQSTMSMASIQLCASAFIANTELTNKLKKRKHHQMQRNGNWQWQMSSTRSYATKLGR